MPLSSFTGVARLIFTALALTHTVYLTDAAGISVVAISADFFHTCAVLADQGKRTVECWGTTALGRMGDGQNYAGNVKLAPSTTGIRVSGITNAVSVTCAQPGTCALLATGSIACWGDGMVGSGDASSLTPKIVSNTNINSQAIAVDCATYHCCALLPVSNPVNTKLNVWCWGSGGVGRLGNGDVANSNVPVPVSNIYTAVSVAGGFEHGCAVLSDGTAMCWGKNDLGQLGTGVAGALPGSPPGQQYVTTPVSVKNLNSAVSVAAGLNHACVLLQSGSVQCWGSNNVGQTGDTTPNTNGVTVSPVTVQKINTQSPYVPPAVSVSCGRAFTCALLSDKTVRCWGEGGWYNLGTGTQSGSAIPVTPLVSNVKAVEVGAQHACVVLSNGVMQCWGRNSGGLLGRGTNTVNEGTIANVAFEYSSPTPSPSDSMSITPSDSHSVTPSDSSSMTPSDSGSMTPSDSVTITASDSGSMTPSDSVTVTASDSASMTPSDSLSITSSDSVTITPSVSPSITSSDSITITASDSMSITPSDSVSTSPSDSRSITPSDSPSTTPSPVCSPGWTALTLPPDCAGTVHS